MAISTNGAIITRLAGALYGEYLSNASYTEVKDKAASTVAAEFLVNDFASKTDAQLAHTILTNLGLTSITGLDNWLSAQLTAAGSTAAAKGAALVSILNSYANMTSDATYGSYATSFNAKVAASLVKSQTAGNAGGSFATSDVVTPTNGTFTLTTGADRGDTFTAGAGSDTFNAVVGTNALTTNGTTLNPGDHLIGGAGTDTLNISVAGTHTAAQTISAVTLSGIENVLVSNFQTDDARDTTVDLTIADGVTTLGVSSSAASGDTLFTGVKTLAAAQMKFGAGDLSITYADAALTGTSDVQTLALEGVTAGTFTAAATATGGVETLAITSSGVARNVLTGITNASTLSTVTVAGSQAVTLGALGAAITTLNASASTGGVTATLSATTTASITGSSGNDVFTSGTVLTTGSVAAGEGADTIVTTGDTVIASSTLGAKYTGFETLSVSTSGAATDTRAQDVSLVSGITGLNVTQTRTHDAGAADTTHGITLSNLSANVASLAITGLANNDTDAADDMSVTVTATRAANTAADSITVNLGTATAVSGGTHLAVGSGVAGSVILDVSLANEESITINSLGGTTGSNLIDDLTNTSATSMTFTGARDLTVDSMTSTVVTSINASAMTGAFMNLTANSGAVASTISGGSGNDSILGGSAADNIYGNSGNDSITANAGNDVVDGGAGNDTIVGGTGVDNLTGSDGDDTFNVTTTTDFIGLATVESVSGGAGNDNLAFVENTAITVAAADLAAISGIERITINGTANAGSVTLTDAVYTSNAVETLRIIDGDLTQGTLTVTASALTGTNSIHVTANSSTTVNDTLTGGAGADTFVFATTAGLESTDTVVGGAGTDTISLTASAAVTANLTGVRTVERVVTTGNGGDVSITVGSDSTIAATGTLTVDASSITNNAYDLFYDGSAETTSTTVQNITGTAGTDTITGGSGNDVINGGDASDTITGGAGIDNLSGGEGADTFVVGTVAHFVGLDSAEVVSGGSGSDTLSFQVGNNALTVAATDLAGINSIQTISIKSENATAALTVTDAVFTANGAATLAITNATNSTSGIQVTASGLTAVNSIQFTGTTVTAVSDSVVGGSGNDSFTFSTAAAADAYAAGDTVNGGAGNDLLTISTGTTALTAATLTNVSNIERLTVSGTTGGVGLLTLADANFATVTGAAISATSLTTGALLVTAAAEDDSSFVITGGSGADSMIGGQLADTISGGAGADTIQGGLLSDSLTGGSGADVFEFTAVTHSSGSNADSITDFASGTDKLNVTLNYTGQTTGLTINATVQTARAGTTLIQDNLSGERGQAVYDTTGSALYVNVNADNLLTTSDYKIGINPATTATATIAEGDINFVITGGSGADTITAGGGADTIDAGAGVDVVTGGAGADSITIADAGDSDTIVFNSAATNGSDTITGFVATANKDILYSRAYTFSAGTAADTALNAANTAACDQVAEFGNNVVAVNATDGVTIATWLAAANATDIDTTVWSRLLILDGGTGVDKVSLYYVANTTTADDNSVTATLIGTFSDITSITGGTHFVATNFDFIA